MNEEENVEVDNSQTTQEEEINLEIDETTEESIDDVKAKLTKAEELAHNYKIRAEKAEKKAKEVPTSKVENTQDLSTKDIYALMNAKVAEEDISEVSDYAKLKKISIADALKTSFVKSILRDKEEERNVALATNTGEARRSTSKVSEEVLVTKAYKGEMPENDTDLQRLLKARKGLK